MAMQTNSDAYIDEMAKKLNLSADEARIIDPNTFMEIKKDPTLSKKEKENMYEDMVQKK